MHNLDRTRLEGDFEDDYGSGQDAGFDDEAELFELEGAFDQEADLGYETAAVGIAGSPFGEAEEMELAAELVEALSDADDAELEQFLGRVVHNAHRLELDRPSMRKVKAAETLATAIDHTGGK